MAETKKKKRTPKEARLIYQQMRDPELVGRIYELKTKGKTNIQIASLLMNEFDISGVTSGDVHKVAKRPLTDRELAFNQADEAMREYEQEKLDAKYNYELMRLKQVDQYLERLKNKVDEIITEMEEKRGSVKMNVLNSARGLANTIRATIETHSRVRKRFKTPDQINISNVKITNNVMNILKHIDLCDECEANLTEYLKKGL